MNKFTKAITGTILMASLAACSTTTGTPQTPDGWDSNSELNIDSRLIESAERSAGATEALAQIESARTAPMEAPVTGGEMSRLPPELLRPTTVEWMGPALDLTRTLAENIGYSYSVVGRMPPVDVMVSISAVDEPAVKVFEDIGYQVSEFASVYVDPNVKRVEFRFKTNEMEAMEAPRVGNAPQYASGGNRSTPPVRNTKDRLGK